MVLEVRVSTEVVSWALACALGNMCGPVWSYDLQLVKQNPDVENTLEDDGSLSNVEFTIRGQQTDR